MSGDEQARQFEEQRARMFAIAYRMLGSVMEAEDIVQEAWLRFAAIPTPEAVGSSRAFLATVVTRLCLDHLKSARVRREQYIGPWLPEPLLTSGADVPEAAGERVDMSESVSMAFLVLLERLNPVERAVFVLREVFEVDYADLAVMVERSEAACRQIFRRAKTHIDAGRLRFAATAEQQQRLTDSFLATAASADLQGLIGLLTQDVTLWTDGGGKRAAALHVLRGPAQVARFIVGILTHAPPGVSYQPQMLSVNGSRALAVWTGSTLDSIVVLEFAAHSIHGLKIVRNPDKLIAVTRDLAESGTLEPGSPDVVAGVEGST